MTLSERISYAKLIIAHSKGDKDEILRLHFKEIGMKTKYMKEDIGYRHSCFYNDRSTDDVTGGRNMNEFVEWVQKEDPIVYIPENFIIVCRVNFLLRGMGKAFGLNLRMSKMWENEARSFLESQNIDY